MKVENDTSYITIKDLLDDGYIDEDVENPFRNTTSRESDFDCIQVYIDENNMLDIKYPASICENKTKEEIKKILQEPRVELINNNEKSNKLYLPKSNEMLNIVKNKIIKKECNYTYNCIKDLQNKIKNGETPIYKEAGYRLVDYYGNEIFTSESDWIIDKKWEKKSLSWTITYSINPVSDIYANSSNIIDNGIKRIVNVVDNDAPVLLKEGDDHEYSYYDNYDKVDAIDNESGDFDFYQASYYSNSYYIFDNFDGYSYNFLAMMQELDLNPLLNIYNINLEDSNNNSRDYNVYVNLIYNESPYIDYIGYDHYMENDLYLLDDNLYSIDGPLFFAYDIDGNISISFCYIFDENRSYSNGEYLGPGTYDVFFEVFDNLGAYKDYFTSIKVDHYPYEEYPSDSPPDDHIYSDDYCGDACIIEQMKENSEAWWSASESERKALHEENEWLSEQLSGDAYYTDDGYWHLGDDYLYGNDYDDYYNNYGYYDDYGYGDYGYYDYW